MTTDDRHRPGTVQGEGAILVIRGSGTHRAWNGIRYKRGMSAANSPAATTGSVSLSIVVYERETGQPGTTSEPVRGSERR